MNVIIDTHIFLWLLNDPLKVKNNYLDILKNTNNDIFLSSINIAELMIKASIGKLKKNKRLQPSLPAQKPPRLTSIA